jgi:SAM-dependent methyltransferase
MERAGGCLQTMNSTNHHHYDHYCADQIKRLDGFYGLIERTLHQELIPHMSGKTILDIGCGFGSLSDFFQKLDFDVTGIEQHQVSFNAAKKKFPHLNLIFDEGNLLDTIPDNAFDIVIMKDVIHHVIAETDAPTFMHNVNRICKKLIIIIDPNPTLILKFSRKIIKHIDPECTPKQAIHLLCDNGFRLKKLFFSEVFAFPLSGGYVGPELIKSPSLMSIILKTDRFLKKVLDFLKLSRFICWRYVIVAEKI